MATANSTRRTMWNAPVVGAHYSKGHKPPRYRKDQSRLMFHVAFWVLAGMIVLVGAVPITAVFRSVAAQ